MKRIVTLLIAFTFLMAMALIGCNGKNEPAQQQVQETKAGEQKKNEAPKQPAKATGFPSGHYVQGFESKGIQLALRLNPLL